MEVFRIEIWNIEDWDFGYFIFSHEEVCYLLNNRDESCPS